MKSPIYFHRSAPRILADREYNLLYFPGKNVVDSYLQKLKALEKKISKC